MNKENPQVKRLLKDIEKNNHKEIIVYTLEGCPACEDLKNKFDKMGLTYEIVVMNGNQEMWDKLDEMGGSEYAPQVQVEDYLIKENEYEDINQLISQTLTNLLERKIIIK
jgi:glutaredoxin